MKSNNSYALPANAARRLLEIANGIETGEDGRIYVEKVNNAFLREGGWPDEYRAGIDKLEADGLIDMHDKAPTSVLPTRGRSASRNCLPK